VVEFVDAPLTGRVYRAAAVVRLADAGPDGLLRPDGVARLLQDVATDDWSEVAGDSDDTWLVRRTAIELVGRRWPRLGDRLELATFCGGTGAAWAERRTDLRVEGELVVRAASIWVPVGPSGRPRRISAHFHDTYDEAAGGRSVPGRLAPPPEPGPTATRRPWPVRRADLDVVGHVNNAVAWEALVEVADGPVVAAELEHHGSLEADHAIELVDEPGRLWLLVDGQVAVTATWATQRQS
jgi:acyl-ACP thioesterase